MTVDDLLSVFERLVTEIDKWQSSKEIQDQGSLEWWIKDEMASAREAITIANKDGMKA